MSHSRSKSRCARRTRDRYHEEAVEYVNNKIYFHPVVMFSSTTCPYCSEANDILDRVGRTVHGYRGVRVVQMDQMGSLGRAIADVLKSRTGRRTVPNIFIGRRNVGGADETLRLARSGSLRYMIRDAVHLCSN